MCAAGLLRCRARGYKKGLRRQDRPQRQRRYAPPQRPVPDRMTKARAVPMPSNSVLAPLYAGADLLDAFAIQLPTGASEDLEVLARAALERQAWWIRALTRFRDVDGDSRRQIVARCRSCRSGAW